jgi:DNA-binding CsgD family transcriptional regulator
MTRYQVSDFEMTQAEACCGTLATDAVCLPLTADGRLRTWSLRARLLVASYLDAQRGGVWKEPAIIRRWARQQSGIVGGATGDRSPLVIAGRNRWLVLRYSAHQQSIFLEECEMPPVDITHFAGLTPREREILQWAAEGKRDAEIAVILSLSERTVSNRLYRIYRKLGVETRTAAVAEFQRQLSGMSGSE